MEKKVIVTFVKRTDLMEFRRHTNQHPDMCASDEYYAKKREVRLVVTERITDDGHIYVRINCPINPLPVKGEFEIPNWAVLKRFLESNGWKQREVITNDFLQ